MAKRPHFADALKKNTPEETIQPVAAKKDTPKTKTSESKEKESRQSNRVGQVTTVTYISPEAKKQLKIMALENDTTQTELFKDALNLLFKKYNKSPIA